MYNNIHQSPHKGRVIDQAVKDTISLKERMGQAETNIQKLDANKADKNTIPKSFKDLEPNTSLVYKGTDEPPAKYDIWFYPKSDTEYVIRVRNNEGSWIDIVSGDSNDAIDEDQIRDIVIEELTLAKESGDFDGEPGYTPRKGVDYWTEEDKAEIKGEIAPFIVNVEVEWEAIKVSESGGVAQVKYDFVVTNADKSYDEICDAASNGMSVIASVFGAGHTSAMEAEKPTYTLCLTEYDDHLIGAGRAVFSGIITTDENVCESVVLILEKTINNNWELVETWSIEKTTLPSKDYVDGAIANIEISGGEAGNSSFIVTGNLIVNNDTFEYVPTDMSATFAEIKEAYDEGKNVIIKVLSSNKNYLYARVLRIGSTNVEFRGFGYECSVDYEEYSDVAFYITTNIEGEWYAYCTPLTTKYDLIDIDNSIQTLEDDFSQMQDALPIRVDVGITEGDNGEIVIHHGSWTYAKLIDVLFSDDSVDYDKKIDLYLYSNIDCYFVNLPTVWFDEYKERPVIFSGVSDGKVYTLSCAVDDKWSYSVEPLTTGDTPFTISVTIEDVIDEEHPDGARLIGVNKTYDKIWEAYNNGKQIKADIMLGTGSDMVYDANVEYTPWGDEDAIAISGYGETESAYHEVLYYPDGTLTYTKRELADKTYVDNQIGDIETALDSIIAIQNQLMGVSE